MYSADYEIASVASFAMTLRQSLFTKMTILRLFRPFYVVIKSVPVKIRQEVMKFLYEIASSLRYSQ
ncbi:MAG: hypothetical protein CVU54_09225 [Deltaproteobacteria bacterium HGW-Deltaproteobacteria-12]|nr:MAG: hypothetical protein CVU54_09225 [Deltaproteobacteria bacterium HGW-Deltaproteobacteria-12]